MHQHLIWPYLFCTYFSTIYILLHKEHSVHLQQNVGGKTRACSLFRNKGFLVNLKTQRNASKFAMFMEKENPRSFFRFSFRATFIFPL